MSSGEGEKATEQESQICNLTILPIGIEKTKCELTERERQESEEWDEGTIMQNAASDGVDLR